MATSRTATKKAPAARKAAAKTPDEPKIYRSTLVVVESPAKAKTIKKYLGAGYTVKASVGHIKDLPKSKLGVDVEHGFLPEYEVIRGKSNIIKEIKKSAKDVEIVYLAPGPDREREAIAWP